MVDGRGNAYVNGEILALVTPDGTVRRVAANFAFPNGMAITPDNVTLVLAESHGKQLTAFDISTDGICLDAEGAVWCADVPNKRCVRVREGQPI